MDILRNQNNFASLSLRDLLEARDQYHVHLLNKRNVVGTAVGLYLIRLGDPWPDATDQRQKGKGKPRGKPKGERTLANSGVRPYSWPCIIVFVDAWVAEDDFNGRLHPQDMVPKTLYLSDGRMIPVCVVKVEPAAPAQSSIAPWIWPETPIGGGFPLLVNAQGIERAASVGCLVSDGHTIYALTNRHVCGAPGQPIYVLGVSVALSEAEVHWRDSLDSLIQRGLRGVKYIASDDHAGLKAARPCLRVCPGSAASFTCNTTPRATFPSSISARPWHARYGGSSTRRMLMKRKRLLNMALKDWQFSQPQLAAWAEHNLLEGFAVFGLPEGHRVRMRTTNGLERLNKELKRRTRVATLFPNPASCLRLVSALLAEQDEEWMSAKIYLNMKS